MSAPGKIGVEEYVDNFLAENSALRRKLQSKAEALLILSKELDQCRTERDQFKLMAEQLQDRYSMLKKKSHDMDISRLMLYSDGVDGRRPGSSLMQVLGETREENKILKIEVEDLRQKLRDSQGDIKALRIKLGQQRINTNTSENQSFPSHQREELVQQLETLSLKCTQLGADLQALLDEKEELVTERDAYKCKVHRLNHELNTLLKGDGKKLVDIDALVMENRYLQERLKQAEEEKELSNQALYKYKSMLDKKRSKGTVKLGTNSNTGMVMSHKQVQQLLEKGTSAQLPNTAATLSDMKSLCLALLEALGDKALALAHQKKANKILATRISELEQRLEAAEGGHVAAFPSQLLLEGYTSSEVDHDVGHILSSSTRMEQSDSEGECLNNVGRENQYLEEVKENIRSEDTNITLSREDKSNHDSLSKQDQTSATLKISARSKLPEKRPVIKGCDVDENEIGVVAWTNCVSDNGDLPPQLQLLVQKALEEIKKEPKSGC